MTKNVPAGATVVGIPGRVVASRRAPRTEEFSPYGTPLGDVPDPVARAIEGLMEQVSVLQARIEQLETRAKEKSEPVAAGFESPEDTAGGAQGPLVSSAAPQGCGAAGRAAANGRG